MTKKNLPPLRPVVQKVKISGDGGIRVKVIDEKVFKAGYIIRREIWSLDNTPDTPMRSAYTPNYDYIGEPKRARYLMGRRGIIPQLRTSTSNVCSIGYAPAEKKWYGWSHRAINGFKVGSTIRKGSCVAGLRPDLIGFTAKTTADTKLLAEIFAESVS